LSDLNESDYLFCFLTSSFTIVLELELLFSRSFSSYFGRIVALSNPIRSYSSFASDVIVRCGHVYLF